MGGTQFSVRQAIQYWADLCLSQITSEQIYLLGVGGGKISALEYKLALVFGVQVGILDGMAGIGASILNEKAWQETEDTEHPLHLSKIDNDSKAIRTDWRQRVKGGGVPASSSKY